MTLTRNVFMIILFHLFLRIKIISHLIVKGKNEVSFVVSGQPTELPNKSCNSNIDMLKAS